METCRIAVRDWDHLTPLLLGEVDLAPVHDAGLDVRVERVATLPRLGDAAYDAAETSMSQYWLSRGRGDDRVTAVPHVLMRGFRHRCVMVRRDSPARSASDLRGGAIGLTGWPDSGNTWTRAALADDGLAQGDARWVVGRLTANHPVQDRLQGHGVPGHIESDPGERPLVDLLASGELDAILTPFMPPGYFAVDSPWRPLYADLVGVETAWFDQAGFVPGMHVLAFRSDRFDPRTASLVSGLFTRSQRVWETKREQYADTTPWLFQSLRDAVRLGESWNAQGLAANTPMFTEFGRRLVDQGVAPSQPALDDLFPHDLEEPA